MCLAGVLSGDIVLYWAGRRWGERLLFLAADAGAALVGVPVSFGLAYLFADQVQGLLADVRRLERWLVLAAVVAAGAWIGVSAWRRSRRP